MLCFGAMKDRLDLEVGHLEDITLIVIEDPFHVALEIQLPDIFSRNRSSVMIAYLGLRLFDM